MSLASSFSTPVAPAPVPAKQADHTIKPAVAKTGPDGEQSSAETAERIAELERRLAAAEQTVEETNREMTSLLYSISHDLRAPLRAMDGFSQALIDDYSELLPEDGHRYLGTIRRGAKRMTSMIDGLLTLSRLSYKPVERQPLDMAALVRDVLKELEETEGGAPAEVQIGEFPPCEADAALVKLAWSNLLSNAFKFSKLRQPALIEVGGRPEGGEIRYFVRDNGIGFDMRYVHKLFGVFQRLHRAEDYDGVGAGLAIVQRIIYRHGGRVWAESVENQQTTFFFTLTSQAS